VSGGVHGTVRTRSQHPATQQAWQAMRILRRFTVQQLVVTSPALRYSLASRYALRLRRCGYLVLAAKRHLGQPGVHDVLQLVRNSGPLAPIARHLPIEVTVPGSDEIKTLVAVFDPNTATTWAAGGLRVDQPAVANPLRPLPPPTALQQAALRCLLAGQPAAAALADPHNNGAVARVVTGLRQRGLVDAAGALTDAGRAMAQAGAAP